MRIKTNLFNFCWVISLVVGVVLRLYYMLAPQTKLSFDEAVYAVQALNILHGERSVFYYNQPYTGTLQAYLAVPFYALFGPEAVWVKLIPFLLSIVFLVTNYLLAKKIFNSAKIGLITLVLTAITSPFWMNWTSRVGSGYSEMMVFGNLAFLLTIKILWEKNSPKRESLWFFLLGLVSGIGFWIQPAVVYYLIPLAIVFLFKRPKVIFQPQAYLTLLGFGLGALPVIIWNLGQGGLTFRSVAHKPRGVIDAIVDFFTLGMPVLVGVRGPSSTVDFFSPLAYAVYDIYLTAFGVFFYQRIKKFLIKREVLKEDLLVLFTFVVPLVWVNSYPFNLFIIEPRYVSPIYTVLPMVAAYFIYLVLQSKLKFASYLGLGLLAILLASNVYGYFRKPPESFLTQYKLDNVINYLKARHVKYVWADFEFSYRLILETNGEITAASFDSAVGRARYPAYAESVEAAPHAQKAFVVTPQFSIPMDSCTTNLTTQKNPCKKVTIDNHFVVYTWQ